MNTLLGKLEKVSLFLGNSLSYLLLVLTLVSVVVVVIRYLFDSGSIMLQESITYFHASIVMLSMAYALQKNSHVRVDIFFHRLSDKAKAWVNFFGTLFLLIPVCVLLLWFSFPYVQRSWIILESSADAGGIPAVFLLKTLLILLPITLLFQSLIELLRNISVLGRKVISEPAFKIASIKNAIEDLKTNNTIEGGG